MDEIIKLLKQDIADCRVNDGNCVDNTDDVSYALATLETLIEAINYTRCCEELKDKEAMTSSEYLISLGYYKKENKWFNKHGYERDFYSLVEIYRDNY
jgi:hypothetical protein